MSGAGSEVPSSTSAARAKVAASRANQPTVSKVGAWRQTPLSDTAPRLGRSPYSPHRLDGTRTDPPESVPSAMSHSPAATAEADPLDDPPGRQPGAAGLGGVPQNGL